MKRKLEISELIFKILSYLFLTVFAVCCLYPFLYAISAAISGREAVEYGQIVLFPKDVQFDAFKMITDIRDISKSKDSTVSKVDCGRRSRDSSIHARFYFSFEWVGGDTLVT